MSDIRLSVAASTDVGQVRKNNEDAFTVADLDSGDLVEADHVSSLDVGQRGVLMVVSDGMGGHAAGEVASALVVDSLRFSLGQTDDVESMQGLINQAVKRANEDVYEAAKDGSKQGMGATLTAVLVQGREAYIAEVGDSRAYVLRRGRLRQMTKDQSFVQVLVDSGALTPEQAKKFTQKNWIVQAMGLERDVEVSIGKLQLRRGDRLLICSDGLHSMIDDKELMDLLSSDDLAEACQRMIERANEQGGSDNVTAVVAEVTGEGLPAPARQESVTQTFEVLQEFAGLDVVDPSRKKSAPLDEDEPQDSEQEPTSGDSAKPPKTEPSAAKTSTTDPPSNEAPSVGGPAEDEASVKTTLMMIGIAAVVLLLVALGYWFFPGN